MKSVINVLVLEKLKKILNIKYVYILSNPNIKVFNVPFTVKI